MSIGMGIVDSIRNVASSVIAAGTPDDVETARQAKRREIRQQLGQRRNLQGKIKAVESQIRGLEARAELAANEHAKDCGPLQKEMAQIEDQVVSLAAADKPVPDKLEKRRLELRCDLQVANERLERESELVQRMIGSLRREIRELHHQMAPLAIENDLSRDGIGRPEMRDQIWVNQITCEHLQTRIDAAKRQLIFIEPVLETLRTEKIKPRANGWAKTTALAEYDREGLALLEARKRRWMCELNYAESQLREVLADGERLVREMIAE